MPRQKKPGRTGVYIEFEDGLLVRIRALAGKNGRTIKDEVQHACRRHLTQPPTLTIEAEELSPAEVVKPAPKRPRARRKKA